MSFTYKNPISSTQITATDSVGREKVFGTNFSVLQTGGYMEVYNLSDLNFTIPDGDTGQIEFTGNTIPVNYSKRTLPFLPDNLTLNSDNISSGRRRLGMLVYVHETQLTYQYTISNFETLWDNASGSTTESDYTTTVSTSTDGGTNFIDAWLDSSVEGQGGVTRENARWKIFYGTDWEITGGTYNSGTGTLSLDNNTGGTINVTGFTSGGGDIAISGITYNGEWGLTENSTDGSSATTLLPFITGGTFSGGELNFDIAGGLEGVSIAFPESSDTFLTGGTITYNSTGDLDLGLNDDTSVNITGLSKITGATLVGSTLTLTDNLGDDVSVSGFTTTTSDTFVTGGTYTESTGILTLDRNDGSDFGISGFEYIKSLSLNNNNLTITPNIGSPILGTVNAITDIGYNGDWALSGTSTGVIYTGTELPFITGGTYSSGTITLGINNGLESNISISGLDSDDTYLTGATYTPTTLTLGMNDGTEFNVGGFAPEITGGTLSNGTLSLLDNTNGSVEITGFTTSGNLYSADGQLESNRVVDQNSNSLTFSGGSVSMGTEVTSPVCALLELASTNQGLLIPRMTQVQRLAIDTPLPGLLLYCTDTDSNGEEGMYMYKSQGWVNVL